MLRRLVAALALCVVAAGPLRAQSQGDEGPRQRKGMWFGFGGGVGFAKTPCTDCVNGRSRGAWGYARLGGTLSPHVRLGGDATLWVYSKSGLTQTLGVGSFIASLYPFATAGLFVQLGIGGATYRAKDGPNSLTAIAPAASVGLGLDLRVGRTLSITPFLKGMRTTAVSYKLNGTTESTGQNVKFSLLQAGLGLSFH
jgi:hypothetical protein